MPEKEGAHKIARRFEAVHLISRFMALIDGTDILPPWHGYMNFDSRKGWPSFVLQAAVNNKLARHFVTSWLFQRFEFHSTYAVSNQLKGWGPHINSTYRGCLSALSTRVLNWIGLGNNIPLWNVI